MVAAYGVATAENLRAMGIEMTPFECEEFVREGLKEALREFWKRKWMKKLGVEE